MQALDSTAFLQFIQQPLQAQLGVEQHKLNCPDRSRYTGHGKREGCVAKTFEGQSNPYNQLTLTQQLQKFETRILLEPECLLFLLR